MIWRFCSDSGPIRNIFVSDSGSSLNQRRIGSESPESIRFMPYSVQIYSGEFGFGVTQALTRALHQTRILPNKFRPILPDYGVNRMDSGDSGSIRL